MQDEMLVPMREILGILFRRKWSMALIFCSTVFTAIFLAYFLISPSYGAGATLILNEQTVLLQPLRDGPPQSDLEQMVKFSTQQDIIASTRIATETVDRIKLYEWRTIGHIEQLKNWVGDLKRSIGEALGIERWATPWDARAAAIGAVEDFIYTSFPSDSNAISIDYRAKNPQEAADTLNALIDVYSEYYYGVIEENANGLVAYLQNEFDKAVDRLHAAEMALTEFKLGATSTGGPKTTPEDGLTKRPPNLLGITDSLRLQSEISSYVLSLEEELRIAQEIPDNDRRQRLVEDIQERIDYYVDFVNQLPRRELEMVRLTREFEIALEDFNLFQRNLAQAKLVAGGQTEQINLIEIFERPEADGTPVSPRKRMIVIMAAFMGVVLAISWAFVLHYFDHTIRSASEVERYFGIRVLASTERI
ncbi:MAG: GNVR domain-containing protein [Gammaproteobacteria bacterium]|nr:hypothetical protein [Pseudomonadales bacterium]